MSAGAFSLSSLYPADRFRVEHGEPVRGGVGSGPRHMFCGSCMTWLYTVPEGMEDYVNVRSPMFADAAEHRPYIETYLGEGLGWASAGAELSFETVPPDEDFTRLIADYAAWDGRVKQ